MGAPDTDSYYSYGSGDPGAVFLYDLDLLGAGTFDASRASGSIAGDARGDGLGQVLLSADLEGDGIDELVASAPGHTGGGRVWFFHLDR